MPSGNYDWNNHDFDTTMKVRNTTRDRLKKRGNKGDSYNMIIVQLLDQAEQ